MEQSLAVLINQLRKDFVSYCDPLLQKLDLTDGLLYFLIYIGKQPGCSPGAVSARLEADTGHTARSIEKLVKLCYVDRRRNDQDRRAFRLYLTQQGQQAFRQVQSLFPSWDEYACKTIAPEQKRELLEILNKIASEGLRKESRE